MSGSKCRGCGAPIRWAETDAGKRMPLDLKPEKRAVSEETEDGRSIVRIVDAWVPHWGTCPVADTFKRSAQADLFGKAGE